MNKRLNVPVARIATLEKKRGAKHGAKPIKLASVDNDKITNDKLINNVLNNESYMSRRNFVCHIYQGTLFGADHLQWLHIIV